jgi:hypothetical protein
MRTVLVLLQCVLDKPEMIALSDKNRDLVKDATQMLGELLKRGAVTEDDRSWLLFTGRLMMEAIF